MPRKGCELCSNPARMFCDSDEASLCWECDEKVHAANFLVAKHSRTLLCHLCHSPTPWKAAGPRLAPTISVCHACAQQQQPQEEEEEEEEEDDEFQDEDGENQVVPWSASSCTEEEEEEEEEEENVSSKRARDDAFASSEDEDGCCSSRDAETSNEESDENYCSSSLSRFLRPLKMSRGLIPPEQAAEPSMGTAAIVEKLRRFEQE